MRDCYSIKEMALFGKSPDMFKAGFTKQGQLFLSGIFLLQMQWKNSGKCLKFFGIKTGGAAILSNRVLT